MADDHHLILYALQAMMKDQFQILAVDNSQAFIHAADEFELCAERIFEKDRAIVLVLAHFDILCAESLEQRLK